LIFSASISAFLSVKNNPRREPTITRCSGTDEKEIEVGRAAMCSEKAREHARVGNYGSDV
jgi:hypothetical protein